MLQLPEQRVATRPPFAPLHRVGVAKAVKSVSTAQQLISDYREAKRDRAIAARKCEALHRKYPDLKEFRPPVLIGEKNGEKIYGRWTDDFDRAFPPAVLKLYKNGKARRRRFMEACEKALPDHRAARTAAGIILAEGEHAKALGRESRLFQRICTHVPTSKAEVALMAAFILKELPAYMASPVFRQKALPTRKDYDEQQRHRAASVYFLADVLRAFAKAGSH